MPPTQPKRKRTRKRKRRAAFSSSSSDSSSSESDDQQECKTLPPPATKPESSSSDSDSESSSSVDSSDEETVRRRPREPVGVSDKRNDSEKLPNRRLSPSPSPPPTELPSFLPRRDQDNTENARMKEEEMKTKFRQFWMASLADGFRDDLEEIRKEPNLGKSRLALLIDSLASGSDVFSSSSNNLDVNEMEVVLS